MSGSMVAILSPCMATSMRRSMPFLGSMTWPPLSTRSYWAIARHGSKRASKILCTNNTLLRLVPCHVFPLPIGFHAHHARRHAVVAEHRIAFKRLIVPDRCLQVTVMQFDILTACLLVLNGLHIFGVLALRLDGEAGARERQRGFVAAN